MGEAISNGVIDDKLFEICVPSCGIVTVK
jgi:hypothetical protein